jgi:hypothetical protein
MGVSAGQNSSVVSELSQSLSSSYPEHRFELTNCTPGTMMQGNDATKSRSLKGITVTGEEIDDLYEMYLCPQHTPG